MAVFDAGWEMDIWGRFQRGIESAGARLDASMLNYDDVRVSLTAEVASAYLQIRTYEQRLQLARDSADLQQDSLRESVAASRRVVDLSLTQ
jgi:outer membrane protein TolC